jgi:hypothetical protein
MTTYVRKQQEVEAVQYISDEESLQALTDLGVQVYNGPNDVPVILTGNSYSELQTGCYVFRSNNEFDSQSFAVFSESEFAARFDPIS